MLKFLITLLLLINMTNVSYANNNIDESIIKEGFLDSKRTIENLQEALEDSTKKLQEIEDNKKDFRIFAGASLSKGYESIEEMEPMGHIGFLLPEYRLGASIGFSSNKYQIGLIFLIW